MKLVMYIINIPVFLLSFFIPKQKNLWIFGSWFKERYADNSRYFFEYINENHPEIYSVWFTNNSDIEKQLKEKGYKVVNSKSMRAIWYILRANYAFFVQGKNDDIHLGLNGYVTKLVQFWHGIPLKKINYDDNLKHSNIYKENIKSIIKKYIIPTMHENYYMMTACSENDRNFFSSAFNIDINKIKITGYPRNDKLFLYNKEQANQFRIIYMPTFRDNQKDFDFFGYYGFDVKKIDEKLTDLDAILELKLHPVNQPSLKIMSDLKKSTHIKILSSEDDIYPLLGSYDILITDYSSVYFDYLLTDNPIIFANFDYEDYIKKNRELYFDYDVVTPGPKCKDWDEVILWIEKFYKNKELYGEDRNSVKGIFHTYIDKNNSKRVLNSLYGQLV